VWLLLVRYHAPKRSFSKAIQDRFDFDDSQFVLDVGDTFQVAFELQPSSFVIEGDNGTNQLGSRLLTGSFFARDRDLISVENQSIKLEGQGGLQAEIVVGRKAGSVGFNGLKLREVLSQTAPNRELDHG